MSSIDTDVIGCNGIVRATDPHGFVLIDIIEPAGFVPESLIRHVSLFEEQASFLHAGTEVTFTEHPDDPFNKVLGRICYLVSPNKYANMLFGMDPPTDDAPYQIIARYRALLAAADPSYWERPQQDENLCTKFPWEKEGF